MSRLEHNHGIAESCVIYTRNLQSFQIGVTFTFSPVDGLPDLIMEVAGKRGENTGLSPRALDGFRFFTNLTGGGGQAT